MYSVGIFGNMIHKSVKTLQRWDRLGILKANRSPSNRRYYSHDQYLLYIGKIESINKKTIVYCRVSSHNQIEDLKSQKEYINTYCKNSGVFVDEWLEDIGSGLNYSRKNFVKIIKNVEIGLIKTIIIAHKDRLVRFGYEWFDTFCKDHGCEIKVILI